MNPSIRVQVPVGPLAFFVFVLSCGPQPDKPAVPFQRLRVHSSAVEHGIADPGVAGSIPAAPLSIFCLIFLSPTFFILGRVPVRMVLAITGHWSSGMILL